MAPTLSDLSPRLRTIADLVLPGRPLADVGTDHALLPAALVAAGVVPRAIGIDVREGPLQAAARTVADVPGVELRRGDGLAPLHPGEAETVVLAGMGGRKIVRLLEAADLSGVRRLVLSPNTDWPAVRAFIAARRWALEDERLVADRDANYLVLAVRPLAAAEPPAWTEADLELGPLLRHRPDPTFRTWVARTLAALDGALARSTDAAPDDPQRRRTLARAALFRAAHEDSAGP